MLRNQKGFTLIEILVVITIIGILIVILAPNMSGVMNNSNVSSVETDLRTIKTGVQQFYIDNRDGVFTEEKVKEYVDISFIKDTTSTASLLIMKSVHKEDPWKNPYYMYISNQGTPYVMIHSYGPDSLESINGADFGDDIVYLFYPNN